jgi:hypothetical protein
VEFSHGWKQRKTILCAKFDILDHNNSRVTRYEIYGSLTTKKNYGDGRKRVRTTKQVSSSICHYLNLVAVVYK